MKQMNIVCTIDENYVQHCAVMINSLYHHNSRSIQNIFIIHNGIAEKSFKKLNNFLTKFEISVHFIQINDSLLQGCPVSLHISLATYFRLFIPEVIPDNIDKILFLDSDIIIRKNIVPFWEVNISRYSHAAVESLYACEDKKRLGISSDFPYFNAGVLLINLTFWRQKQVFSKSLEYIKNNSEKIVWWDQDVLNYLLHPYWLAVSPIWNAQGYLWNEEFLAKYKVTQEDYLSAILDPSIVHFSGAGACKPWHYNCSHPFKDEYRLYLRKSPWKSAQLINQPNSLELVKTSIKLKIKSLFRKFV